MIHLNTLLSFACALSRACALSPARVLCLCHLLLILIAVGLESSKKLKEAPSVRDFCGGDAHQRNRDNKPCAPSYVRRVLSRLHISFSLSSFIVACTLLERASRSEMKGHFGGVRELTSAIFLHANLNRITGLVITNEQVVNVFVGDLATVD